MSNHHQHSLDCIEGLAGYLYCKITGEVGVVAPASKPQSAAVIPFPTKPAPSPAPTHAPAPATRKPF